jgi:hypothetical protein
MVIFWNNDNCPEKILPLFLLNGVGEIVAEIVYVPALPSKVSLICRDAKISVFDKLAQALALKLYLRDRIVHRQVPPREATYYL